MTFRTMKHSGEYRSARVTMDQRGISYWPRTLPQRLRDRLRGRSPTTVGDVRKSWDVLASIELLEREGLQNEPVVDLGAFASETLCSLRAAGFSSLVGVDLDPAVQKMPFAGDIRWHVGDMMRTGFASGTFGAAVSISAIEHGFDELRLLQEVARLLRPGGLFVGSTDYWPDKIDTQGIMMHGLPWKIFSSDEIDHFFTTAKSVGLNAIGPVQHGAQDACIEAADRHYTFGWFAFRKA